MGRVIDRCITTSGICMCEMSQLAFLRWYIYMALGHELYYTVHIMYHIARNFILEKFFALFACSPHFLSHVTDYVEPIILCMVTFMAQAKLYSTEYFCNAMVAGLGEIIFVQRKFSVVQYNNMSNCMGGLMMCLIEYY